MATDKTKVLSPPVELDEPCGAYPVTCTVEALVGG